MHQQCIIVPAPHHVSSTHKRYIRPSRMHSSLYTEQEKPMSPQGRGVDHCDRTNKFHDTRDISYSGLDTAFPQVRCDGHGTGVGMDNQEHS